VPSSAPARLRRSREDRERFVEFLDRLGIATPAHAIARSVEEAEAAAGRLKFPLLVRPSFVLGGRGMAIVYTTTSCATT
jgi:carbamoyl-phosphate synthase large subunit